MPLHPVFDFLPPPKAYAWLVPCYLQAALLHPKVPADVSRPLRLALLPASAYLAWHAAEDCFHPRDITRGLNAGFAFMTAYGLFKAVEWGLAVDRTQYDYVGFSPRAREKQREEKGSLKGGGPVEPDEVTAARVKESWPKALLSQLHLMMSFRMLGYRNYSGKTPAPRDLATFLRDTAKQYLTAHTLFVLSTAFAASTFADRESYLLRVLPFLRRHPRALGNAAQTVATASVYFLAYNGLELTQQIYALGYFVVISAGRFVGLPFEPFETQEYPPLFDGAYRPTSCKSFWVSQAPCSLARHPQPTPLSPGLRAWPHAPRPLQLTSCSGLAGHQLAPDPAQLIHLLLLLRLHPHPLAHPLQAARQGRRGPLGRRLDRLHPRVQRRPRDRRPAPAGRPLLLARQEWHLPLLRGHDGARARRGGLHARDGEGDWRVGRVRVGRGERGDADWGAAVPELVPDVLDQGDPGAAGVELAEVGVSVDCGDAESVVDEGMNGGLQYRLVCIESTTCAQSLLYRLKVPESCDRVTLSAAT